ncbi:RipA family octameric membrane protein [Rickettsia endosymbiont of Halotydeus destructor]|uniref:RipA family octameric membrane protein n=1 Tax=Rickettsia endosymbiont of Halotydeus destructor TaxID=2996754 RepID=UPI003BAE2467
MKEPFISDIKLYEIAMNNKHHCEDRRDEINNYYISLFAALIASMPFIEKITSSITNCHNNYITKLSLAILALIGLMLAITWALNLKHTLFYLQSLDKIIIDLEKKYSRPFVTTILEDLKYNKAPKRVTKHQIIIPYIFIIIFCLIIIYSLWQIAL